MGELRQEWIENSIGFALDRIMSGEPHRHHRACVHNLSREEQLAMRKRRSDGTEWSDEEMAILKLDQGVVVITPADWEIEPPDFGPMFEDS